ncbi:MAG: hypothetical protein JWQ30_2841 [Sediminibacterium sp.]|nr:hypothetical protein [Sediminibacterium sp.]
MKKILYTVCSASHLAHCKTMADSFVECNEGYSIVIGLVDQINNRFDKNEFLPHQLVEVDQIGIPGFEDLKFRYTVLELNCAMKVFVAQYIFQHYNPDILFYLDTDILVQNSFSVLEDQLVANDILITPHFESPFPDNTNLPRERDLLRSGVYNAGFMAFKRSETVTRFLQWWEGHMRTECYLNFAEGMGADQIWLNLVPILFTRTGIVTHPGANLAYWNLHERKLSDTAGVISVNGTEPLLFLHLSGYRIDQPDVLSRHQTRYQLNQFPVLETLFSKYRAAVISNGYEKYSAMPCAFTKPVKKSTGIMPMVNKWLKPLGIKLSSV